MDYEKQGRIDKMNKSFDQALAELRKSIEEDDDNEQSAKGLHGSSYERELKEKTAHLTKMQKVEFAKADKHYKKSMLLMKAKEGKKENGVLIGVIEEKINRYKPLNNAEWEFLGVKNPAKFQNSLMKSISGQVGASPYTVRNLRASEIIADNPGINVLPSGKIPTGGFPIVETDSATLGDVNMRKIYGQFQPERHEKIGSIELQVAQQGRGFQDFIPKGGATSVRYSNQEVLTKIIQRTQQGRQFLSQVQVCEIESLMNRGGKVAPEILRRLFDETDDGRGI